MRAEIDLATHYSEPQTYRVLDRYVENGGRKRSEAGSLVIMSINTPSNGSHKLT